MRRELAVALALLASILIGITGFVLGMTWTIPRSVKAFEMAPFIARRRDLLRKAESECLSGEEWKEIIDLTSALESKVTGPSAEAIAQETARLRAAKRAADHGDWTQARRLLATVGRSRLGG